MIVSDFRRSLSREVLETLSGLRKRWQYLLTLNCALPLIAWLSVEVFPTVHLIKNYDSSIFHWPWEEGECVSDKWDSESEADGFLYCFLGCIQEGQENCFMPACMIDQNYLGINCISEIHHHDHHQKTQWTSALNWVLPADPEKRIQGQII